MRRALSLMVVAALSLGACQAAPAPAGESTEVSLLFSQTAASGRLEPAAGEDAYTLILAGVDVNTIQFADRPARSATVIPLADFVAHWDAFFGDDPPNAALVEHDRSGDADTVVVTLSPPTYDAAGAGELRFDVRVLAAENMPARLSGVARRPHAQPPASFNAVSLFIDDANGTTINGCVIQPYTNCPRVNLAGADLNGATLTTANLTGANLTGANLTDADLTYADLTDADLTDADLTDALLFIANLTRADLTRANLTDAELIDANLTAADLTDALVTDAVLRGAIFCNTTMPDAKINNANC